MAAVAFAHVAPKPNGEFSLLELEDPSPVLLHVHDDPPAFWCFYERLDKLAAALGLRVVGVLAIRVGVVDDGSGSSFGSRAHAETADRLHIAARKVRREAPISLPWVVCPLFSPPVH